MGDLTDKGQRRRVRGEQQRPDHRGVSHSQWGQLLYEVAFEHLNTTHVCDNFLLKLTYRKIANSKTSRLEAHVGFFRLQGIFGPYVL